MIAKAVKGKGFRGALNYDLTHEKGYLLDTNMSADMPRELAAEFGEIRRLRPNLNKAVLHVSLSAAPGEKLNDEQWREIGREYLRGMGLDNNQYVMTRHTDTEHEHIHILANRIRFDGQVTTDSHDYRRQEVLMRKIENDYALQQLEPSLEAERKAPTKDEIECAIRTSEPSTRQQLQQLCDGAAKDCQSMSQYIDRLEHVGVQVVPVLQLEGEKLSGLSYRLDEVTMKGSDLGRGYTPSGLNKRGIEYEKDRDFETVSRARERAEDRALSQPDRSFEYQQAAERGSPSRDAGTLSPSDGSFNRRDTQDLSRHSSREREARAGIQDLDGQHHALMEGSRPRVTERRAEPAKSREQPDIDALHAHDSGRDAFSDARDRIMALAGTATQSRDRHTGVSSGIERRHDRTSQAVEKQIEALGVEQFDVCLIDRNHKEIHKTWNKEELQKSIPWLKRMNARGHDIRIKPQDHHGLVLVGGLDERQLVQLEKTGFKPAITIENYQGEYEVWIKLSNNFVESPIKESLKAELAKRLGGVHLPDYGRLAGFTNQNVPPHFEGLQPYVLARNATGKVTEKGAEWVQVMREKIEKEKLVDLVQKRYEKLFEVSAWWQPDYEHAYKEQAREWVQNYPEKTIKPEDFKKMDLEIIHSMARSGKFKKEDIEKALRELSPRMESSKPRDIEKYAFEMVRAVFDRVDVKKERERNIEYERTREQSRGMSR